MRFEKWQALGNDYLIVEASDLTFPLTADAVRQLCDRHTGPGADGVLELSRTNTPGFVARLRIFNPDGSEAELSGNGAREAVLYLRRSGWTDADEFTIQTKAGPITPTVRSEREATLEMGRASTASADYPTGAEDGRGEVVAAGRSWPFQHVSIGNPQCAIEIGDELEGLDLAPIGPEIENSPLFPNRTNVSFYRVDGDRVRARIFERGVGETLASGTGAAGAAVAAHLAGAPSRLIVELDGGELEVEIGDDLTLRLTGWAEPLFAGELSPELLGQLERLA
jgi:diaminopimelate epimerase